MRRGLVPVVLAAWLAAGAAAALEVQTFPGGRVVSGGVGTEERAELERLRPEFNLRILTARRGSGEFLAGARVGISRGTETVLETTMAGPLMLVALPPGTYRVVVTVDGQPAERTVTLGAGDRRELYLYWE